MDVPSIVMEGLEPEIILSHKPTSHLLGNLSKVTSSASPIFVVGCPRSGTTLLGNVLGGNPRLVNGDESLFLLDMWNLFYQYSLQKNRRGSQYLNSFTSPQNHLQYIADYAGQLYSDLLATKNGAVKVVEHTPVYSFLFPFLELIFYQPIYVHIVRDEQAVISSLAKVKASGGLWGQSTDIQRKAFRNYWLDTASSISSVAKSRYFELSYEDLLNDPKSTLAPLLTSQGLGWDQQMSERMRVWYAQTT